MATFSRATARIITARFAGQGFNVSIVHVYLPTTGHIDQEIEEFYEKRQYVYDKLPKRDIKIIMGDLNASVAKNLMIYGRISTLNKDMVILMKEENDYYNSHQLSRASQKVQRSSRLGLDEIDLLLEATKSTNSTKSSKAIELR